MKTRIFFTVLVMAFCFLVLSNCKTTPPESEPEEATQEMRPAEPQPEPLSPAVSETLSQPQQTPTPPQGAEKHVRVRVGMANVRSEPSMTGQIIAVVKKGDIYVTTGQEEDWLKLRLRSDREGWIYHKLVEKVQQE